MSHGKAPHGRCLILPSPEISPCARAVPFVLECRPNVPRTPRVECLPRWRAVSPPVSRGRCVVRPEAPVVAPASNVRWFLRVLRKAQRDPLGLLAEAVDAAVAAEARASQAPRPEESAPKRKPIPKRVRQAVWTRDGGRCVVCGTNRDIQFDHIIPVSKGGSNAPGNLELRCGRDNRIKGDRIE